jgi:hypothetical protein
MTECFTESSWLDDGFIWESEMDRGSEDGQWLEIRILQILEVANHEAAVNCHFRQNDDNSQSRNGQTMMKPESRCCQI